MAAPPVPARTWSTSGSAALLRLCVCALRLGPLLRRSLLAALSPFLLLIVLPSTAQADTVQLSALELTRADDGLQLSFSARFELPHAVEDALMKGVPLYFLAEADLYRGRWYWRDQRIAHVSRTWRLAWQPLARSYRVSFGGLNQSFDSLQEAMAAVRGAAHWKVADLSQLEPGTSHYVEFSYRLDTSQLPRPMQIGLAGQADWDLIVERSLKLD